MSQYEMERDKGAGPFGGVREHGRRATTGAGGERIRVFVCKCEEADSEAREARADEMIRVKMC